MEENQMKENQMKQESQKEEERDTRMSQPLTYQKL